MCMHVVYVYVCLCTQSHPKVIYIYMYIGMFMCVYPCIYVPVYCIHASVYVHIHVCILTMYMWVCMHIYVYPYMCAYTHTLTHTHTHTRVPRAASLSRSNEEPLWFPAYLAQQTVLGMSAQLWPPAQLNPRAQSHQREGWLRHVWLPHEATKQWTTSVEKPEIKMG